MNILFICKYNQFRSRIANAYFKKINRAVSVKSKSAGIKRDRLVSKFEKSMAKKYKLNISGTPKKINIRLLNWADLIVIVADNVPISYFKDKKVIRYKVKEANENNEKEISKEIKTIMKKVEMLNNRLKKEKWKQ